MWSTRVKTVLWSCILVVLVLLVLYLWMRFGRVTDTYTSTPGRVTVAAPPKVIERVIEKIRRVEVKGPERIVYLDRPATAAKLKMPELEFAPDNAAIISVAKIPPHIGSTTVISELTPQGEGRLTYRQEPPPFFDLKREFRLQGRYMLLGANMIESDLVVNPLRVGPVEVEAGVGLEIRRDDQSVGARAWIGAAWKF